MPLDSGATALLHADPANAVTARRHAHDAVVRDFATRRGGHFLVVSRSQHFYLNLRNAAVRFLSLPEACVRPVWPPETIHQELAAFKQAGIPSVCFIDCDATEGLCAELLAAIRKEHPEARIIILAFEMTRDRLVYLHEEGADNVLVLPASADALIERVAFTIHPPGPEADLFQSGHEAVRNKAYSEAAAIASRILAAKPGSPGGLILLGDALRGMGHSQEALEAYGKAARGETLFLAPLARMAQVHHEEGHLGREIEFLEKLSELSPLNAGHKVAIGANHLRLGDRENAHKAFEEAYRTASGRELNTPSMVSRAIAEQCLEFAPDYSERYFRRALGEQAGRPAKAGVDIMNRLGLALRRQGKWEEAVTEYSKALKMAPDNATLLFNIAMAYSEGGKPGDAARILDRVLDSEPDFCERNPKACVNAAMAYRKAGRPADARRLIETALEKEPELREAREMLQSLAQ